jgi:hypothetical protein
VALLHPATRQPYGVVRVPLEPAAAAGAGADSAYVLTPLDASAPGFQRGSCWLEVHRQVRAHACLRGDSNAEAPANNKNAHQKEWGLI